MHDTLYIDKSNLFMHDSLSTMHKIKESIFFMGRQHVTDNSKLEELN